MSTLEEQVAAIKPGDKVTARFRHRRTGEFTVAGTAGFEDGLFVGTACLLRSDGGLSVFLVAIESHEPAKPPVPPEPTGDVLVLIGGEYWAYDSGTERWHGSYDNTTATWEQLNEAGNDPHVYRLEPSPERVEELVRSYTEGPALGRETGWIRDLLSDFAAELLAGEPQ